MVRLFKAKFACSLGEVGITVDSQEKLEKAYSWFCKRYENCKIVYCKEVFSDAERKEELHIS